MTFGYCAVCGKIFHQKNHQQKCCCKACAMVYVARQRGFDIDFVHVANETPQGLYELEYTRTCHDCGRPTNNYRCADCLKKWRKKNGVEVEDYPEEADDECY